MSDLSESKFVHTAEVRDRLQEVIDAEKDSVLWFIVNGRFNLTSRTDLNILLNIVQHETVLSLGAEKSDSTVLNRFINDVDYRKELYRQAIDKVVEKGRFILSGAVEAGSFGTIYRVANENGLFRKISNLEKKTRVRVRKPKESTGNYSASRKKPAEGREKLLDKYIERLNDLLVELEKKQQDEVDEDGGDLLNKILYIKYLLQLPGFDHPSDLPFHTKTSTAKKIKSWVFNSCEISIKDLDTISLTTAIMSYIRNKQRHDTRLESEN